LRKVLPYQFVTLFSLFLGPDGAGQFISAGHNPAYLFRSATGKIEKLASEPSSWGCSIPLPMNTRTVRLDQGDILVVYSDGLTDAESQQGDMFGRKTTRTHPQEALGKPALERAFLKAIEEFTQGNAANRRHHLSCLFKMSVSASASTATV